VAGEGDVRCLRELRALDNQYWSGEIKIIEITHLVLFDILVRPLILQSQAIRSF
jgi:hypothetical protein